MAKFSRFVQEAATRSLLSVTKLENGQLEIDLPGGGSVDVRGKRPEAAALAPPAADTVADEAGSRPRRGRRGRGGRGRADRPPRELQETINASLVPNEGNSRAHIPSAPESAPVPDRVAVATLLPVGSVGSSLLTGLGQSGIRLTRTEAFDVVRRAVASLTEGDAPVRASAVRARVHELLGHDSESLEERMFIRILKDAHDSGIVDLRRRGDDFDVARASEPESVATQSSRAEEAAKPAVAPPVPGPRIGMGPRGGSRTRGLAGAPPPELLMIGVVQEPRGADQRAAAEPAEVEPTVAHAPRKSARKKGPAAEDGGEHAGAREPASPGTRAARGSAPKKGGARTRKAPKATAEP